ncbi:hypothetical protein CspHIS471_0301250 [Cutaneotrichosporon sp. HIS471]|nr:hypothetical protein CspHIS471_0301250 [Cutaneotrichosporon sp. HIS471]
MVKARVFQKKHKGTRVQKFLLYFFLLPFALMALGWFIPPLYTYSKRNNMWKGAKPGQVAVSTRDDTDARYYEYRTIYDYPYRKRAETEVALEDGAPVTIAQVQVPMSGTAAIQRPKPPASTHAPTPTVINPADAGPTEMPEPSPNDNSEALRQLYKRRRGGGGGGGSGSVPAMPPVQIVSVVGVVWTSLLLLYLLMLLFLPPHHQYRGIMDNIVTLTFFWMFGLGVMIAASLIVNGRGFRYMGACLLAFGWLLVVALTFTLLWHIVYAFKFHRGFWSYSIESLEKERENMSPGDTPPEAPAKDEPSPASPSLAYALPTSAFSQQAYFQPDMSSPLGYPQFALVPLPPGYPPQYPASPASGFNVPGSLPPDSHYPVQPMQQGYGYQSPQMSGQVGQQAYPQPQHIWVTTQGSAHRPTEV